ncbi:MAG: septum formation protein Maf [Clostridia bacterium]|nr:septum formation protein Maf [Clostridia bacterium]
MRVILASASPRRKEIFGEICETFEIIPAKGEERASEKLSPEALVKELAFRKAREVADEVFKTGEDALVLGSDTVVALENAVLGKPKDRQDAIAMLTSLSGRVHEVFTGVCFIRLFKGKEELAIAADCTKVEFETLTQTQIAEYVLSGSPMDKAGAYGIQDGGLVKRLKGSYSNVVGLPKELTKELFDALYVKQGEQQ